MTLHYQVALLPREGVSFANRRQRSGFKFRSY
jgi:hypothetical protein